MINYYDLSDYWTNSVDKEVQRGTKLRKEKLELCPISQDYDEVDIDFDHPFSSSTYKKKSSNRSPVKVSSRVNFIYPNIGKTRKRQKKSKNIQRKHNKINCPIRILELSVPTKRHCLETWRDNQDVLPNYMVERLRQIIMDEKPIVQLSNAVNYLKNRKPLKLRSTIVKNKILKTKVMQKLKILCAIFAYKISQKLLRPLNISLNQQLRKISQVINNEISTIINNSKKHKNRANARIQTEIADKVTVWIADILEESECKLILEDFEDLRKQEEPVWDLLDGLVDRVTTICVPESVESKSTTELNSQFSPRSSRTESSLVSHKSTKNINGTVVSKYDTENEANIFVSMLLDILKNIDCIKEQKLENKSAIFDDIKKIIDEVLNNTGITSIAKIESNSDESVQNIRKSEVFTMTTQDFKDKDVSLNNTNDSNAKLTEENNINDVNESDTEINEEVPFTNIHKDPLTNIESIKSQDSILQDHTIQELYIKNMDANLSDIDMSTQQRQAFNELYEINSGENNHVNNKQITDDDKLVYITNFKEDSTVDTKNNKSNNSEVFDNVEKTNNTAMSIELTGIKEITQNDHLKNKLTDSSLINIQIDESIKNNTENSSQSNISINDKLLSDNNRDSGHIQNDNEMKYVDEAEAFLSDEVKSMQFEDTPDDSIKKVKFSNINIGAYREKQLKYDSNSVPTQNTNIKIEKKDIWRRSSKVSIDKNIRSELYFAPPNDNLLSDADESWPEDLQLPILKATVSISKSIQSLGNIVENEEEPMTSQDNDLHETNAVKSQIEVQLKTNDSNITSTSDRFEKSLKLNKEIGENQYLNLFQSNAKQFHNDIMHRLKDVKLSQMTITHVPIIHIDQKVKKESIRDEGLQTDEDAVNICDQRAESEFRQWCLGLENVIENLEIWKEWLQNISTYIMFLKYKESDKKDNTQKWMKLKEIIDIDVKVWSKLSKNISKIAQL